MSHTLIGSSNVANLYLPERFKNHPPYNLMKCVKLPVFNVNMTCIKDEEKFVIISVLENFIVDAVKNDLEAEDPMEESYLITTIVEGVVREVLLAVKTAALRLPGSAFVMVQPIKRPAVKWYNDRFDNICKIFEDQCDELTAGQINVARIDSFAPDAQIFDERGIHLVPESMRVFVELILTAA